MDFNTLIKKLDIKKQLGDYFNLFGPIKKTQDNALEKSIASVSLNGVHLEAVLARAFQSAIISNGLRFSIDYEPGSHESYDMMVLCDDGNKFRLSFKGCKGHKHSFDLSAYRLGRFKDESGRPNQEMINYVNECNSANKHISLVRSVKRDFCLPNGVKRERDSEYKLVHIDPKVLVVSFSDDPAGSDRVNSHGVRWGIRPTMSYQLWYKIPWMPEIETIATYSLDEFYKDF